MRAEKILQELQRRKNDIERYVLEAGCRDFAEYEFQRGQWLNTAIIEEYITEELKKEEDDDE